MSIIMLFVLVVFAVLVVLVLVLVAALLVFAATKPDTFRIQRAASMRATAEKIFPYINDFHSWVAWSPWEKLDPNLKRTYSGAADGKGAVYEWEGTGKVGKGRMEITDVSAPSKVIIKLDFIKPFEGHNIAEFTLDGQGDSTNVTWVMHGKSAFMSKVMSVFMNFDKLIGKDFEAGLANLKAAAEK